MTGNPAVAGVIAGLFSGLCGGILLGSFWAIANGLDFVENVSLTLTGGGVFGLLLGVLILAPYCLLLARYRFGRWCDVGLLVTVALGLASLFAAIGQVDSDGVTISPFSLWGFTVSFLVIVLCALPGLLPLHWLRLRLGLCPTAKV